MREELRRAPNTWLVAGCPGFIGSNLLETLLSLRKWAVGLDNVSPGQWHVREDVRARVGEEAWRLVYAASSSTYGDHPGLPTAEEHRLAALSVCGDEIRE